MAKGKAALSDRGNRRDDVLEAAAGLFATMDMDDLPAARCATGAPMNALAAPRQMARMTVRMVSSLWCEGKENGFVGRM